MRHRSFHSRPFPAAACLIAILGVSMAAVVFGVTAAMGAPMAGDPGAAAPASPTPAGDVFPAIAGRVDPGTYRVGPGDEFAFRSSDLLDPKILRVGPTGEILLPDAGVLPVAGMTLAEAEARALESLRPFIRGKGFVFTLYRPRRFRSVVVGDVRNPGAVLLQAPARVSDAIEAAGGIVWPGARRGIALRRDADTLWADLVRFERTGDPAVNPLVFETDVVVVPASSSRVTVLGAVAHPGDYDLAPGDRASTLLEAAGGLLPRAAGVVMLSREPTPGRRDETALSVPLTADPPLLPGDQILVPERAHWREGAHVEVRGEVALPGPYAVVDGVDRVGGLLERAGGLTAWADSAAIRIERRSDAAVRDSAFLRLAREQENLLSADERDYVVAVVRKLDALSLAGARDEGAWRDLALLDGDRLVVPRRSLTVMVQGEVRIPGHVPFQPGLRVPDYVRAAGGYTGRAHASRTRVTLATTGRPVNAGDVGTLQAGDVIWVPARPPHSFWGVARDVLTTAAQAATIYLVVREATK